MVTIFSRVKAELLTILTTHLVDTGVVQEVRTSRGYDTAATPYVIVSTGSYNERVTDESDEVYLNITVIAKFTDATEEEAAEVALDDVEQVLIDLFNMDGLYQVHRGHWGAIDRWKPSWRPFSPVGPGYRYGESYFRFIV